MKKTVLFFLGLIVSCFPIDYTSAQDLSSSRQLRFAVISNPSVEQSTSATLFNSMLAEIDTSKGLDFLIILGNLTGSGTEKEFLTLKSSLNKLTIPYYLLPGKKDARNANGWLYFKELYDDKFVFDKNDIVFIGLSTSIPFMNINHMTIENYDWLNTVLDTLNRTKNIFFFTPSIIDEDIDNFKDLLNLLSSRNLRMVVNGFASKNEVRNLHGYNILNISNSLNYAKSLYSVLTCEIKNDSIYILDKNKIIHTIDKSINIEKEKVIPGSVEFNNSEMLMQTDLASTMLTSTLFWNNKIYISDESGLISCIDTTGKLLWDYDTYGSIYGQPVIADRMLAAATLQGDVVTLSAISGEQIQSIGFEERITSNMTVINYSGTRELMIPKLTNSKSAIVLGTADGKVYCYDFETLQEYWVNTNSKDMICSDIIYVENKLLYTSRDGYLYCVDARNGLMIWRWKEKSETDLSYSQILHDGKKVYIASEDGTLYAINLLLGKMEWKSDKYSILQNIGLSNNARQLYALSKNNLLLLINTANGRIEKEIKLSEKNYFSPSTPVEIGNNICVINNGSIYFIDNKNTVKKILFMGNAAIHPLIKIGEEKYLASNIDGRIIIFSMR